MAALLASARQRCEKQEQTLRQSADVYLIPAPSPRAFNLERNARVVFEDDERFQSYFSARTRYGNYKVQTVVVEREEWLETVQAERSPGTRVLQQLMLASVNLPRWWLEDLEPADEFLPVQPAPRWLPAERVLVVHDGVWQGRPGERQSP